MAARRKRKTTASAGKLVRLGGQVFRLQLVKRPKVTRVDVAKKTATRKRRKRRR